MYYKKILPFPFFLTYFKSREGISKIVFTYKTINYYLKNNLIGKKGNKKVGELSQNTALEELESTTLNKLANTKVCWCKIIP